jgi:Holliday junction resolvase
MKRGTGVYLNYNQHIDIMKFSTIDVSKLNKLQCLLKDKIKGHLDIYKFNNLIIKLRQQQITDINRLAKLHRTFEKMNYIHSLYKMHRGYRSNYHTGIRAEKLVKKIYEMHGWKVIQSAGSRGAGDLMCTNKNNSHYVQCKSSTTSHNPRISKLELINLKNVAKKKKAIPIIAKLNRSKILLIKYLRSGKEVKFKNMKYKKNLNSSKIKNNWNNF